MPRKAKRIVKPTCEDPDKLVEDHCLDLSGVKNPKQRAFLAAFSRCGSSREACSITGVSRATEYNWVNKDPAFVALREQARQVYGERSEEIARRLSTIGRKRKIFHQGKPVIDPETGQQYVEYDIDTTLLIFRLKSIFPEKYRDNVRHEVTGKDGKPIQQETTVNIVTDLEKCAKRFDEFASRASDN